MMQTFRREDTGRSSVLVGNGLTVILGRCPSRAAVRAIFVDCCHVAMQSIPSTAICAPKPAGVAKDCREILCVSGATQHAPDVRVPGNERAALAATETS